MTPREVAYLVVIVALGAQVGRDMLALHRWRPGLFRAGPVLMRHKKPLASLPRVIPMPNLRTGWFYSAKYKVLSELEVAFTAATFNAPCLLGRLVVERDGPSLIMQARPLWSLYAIFLVGFMLARFPWYAILFVVGLMAVNVIWEVGTFHRLFRNVGDQIDHDSGV